MTPPDDLVRLPHLRDAAEKAIEFSAGKTRDDLEDDELLRLALTKLVALTEMSALSTVSGMQAASDCGRPPSDDPGR